MFKLVGRETFSIGNIKCCINAEARGPFTYLYTLEVNGKTYEKFREDQSRQLQVWYGDVEDKKHRICLGFTLRNLPLIDFTFLNF